MIAKPSMRSSSLRLTPWAKNTGTAPKAVTSQAKIVANKYAFGPAGYFARFVI